MIKWLNLQEAAHTVRASTTLWGLLSSLCSWGFSLAKNTEDSMYQYLGKHPEKAKRFAVAMSVQITDHGYELEHNVKNGPWDTIEAEGIVVDLGGSHGDAMVAVAKAFPQLRCDTRSSLHHCSSSESSRGRSRSHIVHGTRLFH